MAIWDTVGEDYLYSLGIKPREDLKETFRKMTLYQAACYYKSEYGVSGTVEEIMAGVNQMIRCFYENQVLPKQGAVSFLHRLHAAGIKICVATATEEDLVKAALGRNGMLDYFSAVFTCTNVGHGKDEPDIFEAARRFLGTEKSETLVLEDALYAARTAKEAGFPVCAIYAVSYTHLYSLIVHPDAELEKTADEAIDVICAAQQPDGYLDTYYCLLYTSSFPMWIIGLPLFYWGLSVGT